MQINGELYALPLNVWGENPLYLMFWTQGQSGKPLSVLGIKVWSSIIWPSNY
jgi:hypothetical protein